MVGNQRWTHSDSEELPPVATTAPCKCGGSAGDVAARCGRAADQANLVRHVQKPSQEILRSVADSMNAGASLSTRKIASSCHRALGAAGSTDRGARTKCLGTALHRRIEGVFLLSVERIPTAEAASEVSRRDVLSDFACTRIQIMSVEMGRGASRSACGRCRQMCQLALLARHDRWPLASRMDIDLRA